MSKQKMTTLAAFCVCSLLLVLSVVGGLAGVVLANGTPAIDWYVIGGGGGYAEGGGYALDGTMGQALVGLAGAPGYELCAGFWCGAEAAYQVYLPLVLRNAP